MNKSFATFLILLLSFVLISITVGFIYLMKSNFSFNFNVESFYSEKLVESKTFETINDIYILSKNCDVSVEQSNYDNIVVELYSDNVDEFFVNQEDNNIYVELFNKSTFGFNIKTSRIIVKLPKNYENMINVDATVGDISIDEFELARAYIKNTVGDVNIKNINVATIINQTGDIKIETIKNLITTNKTGDVKVGRVNNIDAKVDTGDIKIETVSNKVDLISGIGDVKIEDANLNEESKIDSKIGDIKIKKLTGVYVEANTKIGDIKLNNVDRKSENVLKIDNNTGDIKVNID